MLNNKQDSKVTMINKLIDLKNNIHDINILWITKIDLDDFDSNVKYPFNISFDELDELVEDWIINMVNELKQH